MKVNCEHHPIKKCVKLTKQAVNGMDGDQVSLKTLG